MKFKKSKIVLVASILALIFCNAALAGKPAKVLILPFAIHSERDLSFLRDGIVDMLSTRLTLEDEVLPLGSEQTKQVLRDLSEPVTEKAAVSLAKKLGADYVVFGSLTVFGDSMSTDARFFDVLKKKSSVTFHESGKGHSDVIYHINLFAGQINEQVFGRKTFTPRPSPKQVPADESRKHPELLWKESKTEKKTPDAADESEETLLTAPVPASPSAPVPVTPGSVWKSRNFRIQIKGMAVGDVDDDGTNETVFVSQEKVFVYRHAGKKFAKIGEIKGSAFYSHIGVDVADINGNGRAEIFVTSINNDSHMLLSFVLEWDGTRFGKIVDKSRWYYRVLNVPGQGNVLLGQTQGIGKPFAPGIYQMKWNGREYMSSEPRNLPRGTHVFGFAYGNVLGNDQDQIVAFAKDDHIRVFSWDGNEEWKSSDRFGGSTIHIDFPAEASASIGDEKEMDRLYLPQRIHIADVDKDGKNEVIVVKNTDMTRGIFSRVRMFKSGHIQCLGWETLGLYPKWTTREISGYISDYAVADMDNDGHEELVFSVVTKAASAFGKAKSFIGNWKLGTGN